MIEVTQFSPVHADGVVAVILPIQQTEFEIPITIEAQPDLRDISGFYQRDNGNFWVALDDAQIDLRLSDSGYRTILHKKDSFVIDVRSSSGLTCPDNCIACRGRDSAVRANR